MNRAEIGGIAAVHLCHATEPQRLDIVAQQRPRLGAVIDEQREFSTARDRLDAERAGAGEQVEHARVLNRIVIGVDEDIEQRLAQPVRGRADVARGRRHQIAAPQSPADDAHGYALFPGGENVAAISVCPLSHGERGGVRGYGLSIDRNPSPGSLRDPTSPNGRGVTEPMATPNPRLIEPYSSRGLRSRLP